MRLPLAKVYRAFPELDRFTDEQCAEYVRQVRRRFRGGRRVHGFVLNVATFGLALTVFFGMIFVFIAEGGDRGIGAAMLNHPVFGAFAIGTATAAPAMLLRYWLKHRWLRRRIRAHMGEIRCAQCRYLLLRLAVRDGVVTCPECGEQLVLASLGLAPEDVMATTVEGDEGGEGAAPDHPPAASSGPGSSGHMPQQA
jgi:ribosomal protein S27E